MQLTSHTAATSRQDTTIGPRDFSLLEGLRAVPPPVARNHRVIPLRYDGDRLIAGARDPSNLRTRDTLLRLGHSEVVLQSISEQKYEQVMGRWYGPTSRVAELVTHLSRQHAHAASSKTEEDVELTAAPRFLDLTLGAALAEGASDIHIEPDHHAPRVRFRVDGMLAERISPPPWLMDRVIGRIKALAGLVLGECLFPQDGMFEFPSQRGPLAVRVSILPCDRGECAVLRLLTVADQIPSLEDLGVPETARELLVSAASVSEGLIVFAGPTGSGKTTTLHALLETMDAERRNIVSIEDPVEIHSRRLRQVGVRRGAGFDFSDALRSVLRQDPDVILVGETRDQETAQLVVQAALAGHLVLTTVHAGSALEVFDRFAQLGADRSLIAQVTRLVASQRLLRRICPDCQGQACFTCEGSGLKGRVCLFETLRVGQDLGERVRLGAPLGELREVARADGFRSFTEEGNALVHSGVTTATELARVVDVQGKIPSSETIS